ncbi:MAG: site-specific integrase [Chloroflexi bacterium]|nr:site-specific integrase [Chloroflexota bacterium]
MAKKRGNQEGSVFQRKDGRWVASVIQPDGRRKSYYARTRQGASQELLKAQKKLSDGLPLTEERVTVGAFLEDWLSNTAERQVRLRTLRRYQEIVRLHLHPAIGHVRLSRLTPSHVEKMMNDGLAAGQSPRSVSHHRAVLRTALNVAMRDGHVVRNVASLAAPPQVPEREFHAMSLTEARALLEAVKGDRLEALFTVPLAIGLRQGEALGLRWPDVDFASRQLSVRRNLQRIDGEWRFLEPKTKKSRRTISLPAPIVDALHAHRTRQLEERLRAGAAWEGNKWGDLVFTDELGRPLSGFHALRRLRSLVVAAGLPPMRYHDLRHGAISLMAALGIPPRVAMEIAGHSDIGTTMNIYSHVPQEVQQEAAEKIAASLWNR